MEAYKKLVLIGGIIGALIDFGLTISTEDVRSLAMIGISLNLVAITITFTISNSKVVGVILLIISIATLLVTWPTAIVGFLLFLPGGIVALRHKDEEEKEKERRRKALGMILAILEKINTIYEWNQRLHDLHNALTVYDYLLPKDIRQRIDEIDRLTDFSPDGWKYKFEDLKQYLNDRYNIVQSNITNDSTDSSTGGISKRRIAKIIIGGLAIILIGGAIASYYGHSIPSSSLSIHNGGDGDGDKDKSPIADAGDDQEISCSSVKCVTVTLDGSDSSDPDGDFLHYSWKSTEHSVQIENADTDQPNFTPYCYKSNHSTTYKFKLTVEDDNNKRDSDTTNVIVACGLVG